MPPRKSQRGRRTRTDVRSRQSANSVDDGAGCLIVLLFGLWFFGYLSFHSRERGEAISRLSSVTAELKQAETELVQLTTVLEEMKSETAELSEERKALARQVARLERVRSNIASNLDAAEGLVAPARGGRIDAARHLLFDGVPGNIVASALVALFGIVFRKQILARLKRSKSEASDAEQPGR